MLRLQIRAGHGVKICVNGKDIKIRCFLSQETGKIDWSFDAEKDVIIDRMFPTGETYNERFKLKQKQQSEEYHVE